MTEFRFAYGLMGWYRTYHIFNQFESNHYVRMLCGRRAVYEYKNKLYSDTLFTDFLTDEPPTTFSGCKRCLQLKNWIDSSLTTGEETPPSTDEVFHLKTHSGHGNIVCPNCYLKMWCYGENDSGMALYVCEQCHHQRLSAHPIRYPFFK